jgi:hypothetical protein
MRNGLWLFLWGSLKHTSGDLLFPWSLQVSFIYPFRCIFSFISSRMLLWGIFLGTEFMDLIGVLWLSLHNLLHRRHHGSVSSYPPHPSFSSLLPQELRNAVLHVSIGSIVIYPLLAANLISTNQTIQSPWTIKCTPPDLRRTYCLLLVPLNVPVVCLITIVWCQMTILSMK